MLEGDVAGDGGVMVGAQAGEVAVEGEADVPAPGEAEEEHEGEEGEKSDEFVPQPPARMKELCGHDQSAGTQRPEDQSRRAAIFSAMVTERGGERLRASRINCVVSSVFAVKASWRALMMACSISAPL